MHHTVLLMDYVRERPQSICHTLSVHVLAVVLVLLENYGSQDH